MRRLVLCCALLLGALAASFPPAAFATTHHPSATISRDLTLFETERVARKHCPHDEVVWLNTNSGIWHEKGMRWYGRTKHGAYVCEGERPQPATVTRATDGSIG